MGRPRGDAAGEVVDTWRVDHRAGHRFEALVFDLDGVIVDTELTLYEVWNEVFADYGCAFTRDEWQALVGTSDGPSPYDWLASRSTRALPSTERLKAEIVERELARVLELRPKPGVLEWIGSAGDAGLALAVASSASRAWVEARLDQVGLLHEFAAVVAPDGTFRSKPAPDLYLEACRLIEVAPSRAVAVEDSLHGVVAATTAGLSCVAVPHALTADLDFAAADLVLASLAELDLTAALARLEREGPGGCA
jgi:HAD superfamily hydrolase (TIGR01509 family)